MPRSQPRCSIEQVSASALAKGCRRIRTKCVSTAPPATSAMARWCAWRWETSLTLRRIGLSPSVSLRTIRALKGAPAAEVAIDVHYRAHKLAAGRKRRILTFDLSTTAVKRMDPHPRSCTLKLCGTEPFTYSSTLRALYFVRLRPVHRETSFVPLCCKLESQLPPAKLKAAPAPRLGERLVEGRGCHVADQCLNNAVVGFARIARIRCPTVTQGREQLWWAKKKNSAASVAYDD